MGSKTAIEWTVTRHPDGTTTPGATFNSWWGCTKISPACAHCYAAGFDKRIGGDHWGANNRRRFFGEKHWQEPITWNAKAEKSGKRIKVFCASMADIGEILAPDHPDRAQMDTDRRRLFNDIIPNTPYLDWLLLTKRIDNLQLIVPPSWNKNGYPRNVWIGCTVEHQKRANECLPHLVKIPAVVRFVSMEPLLEPVDLASWMKPEGEWRCTKCRFHLHKRLLRAIDGAVAIDADRAREVCPNDGSTLIPASLIDWVIAGGESGHNARPTHPDWVRSLRDQCQKASIPFFFKQWGSLLPWEHTIPPFLMSQRGEERDGHGIDIIDPDTGDVAKGWHEASLEYDCAFQKVAKHYAGRLLDGRTWDEMPDSYAIMREGALIS